ncbi:nucleotide sugar dehydrogenase [Aureispira anguillae]|uniref:Nucleotide sugar dehydrogenase n=1 Tax=Aureispira anguillae TaxID=2864201 RepID=A0A916DXN6_9BACT|nr:nucleotide sugar dehydrogenase [Aureispira anguillae]BDS15251.1 nucleotide sugar dehydrogenase [Aureispira anguillae]
MYQQLVNKEKKIAIIGLGYVGLPIALAFARKVSVIGFDINAQRVEMMKQNIDPSKELEASAFEGCDIQFTADIEDLKEANFFVVAVPTPIDSSRTPNLKPLLGASNTVGQVLKKGDYVVFESTVYPGCTEEDCLPILEELSGLTLGTDFKIGYSPERINPGDKERTIEKIVKVVSGSDADALENIAKVYELIIEAGVHRATSIKVAEAAKVIENTQRDLNIALMNELSIIFDKMDIPTMDVLKAAGTKWNFLKFYPGLVGGHCIGVDPYYLTFKAQKLDYNPQVILSGRRINDNMSSHVATKLVQLLLQEGKDLKAANVLVMGVTFKENVSDIRNSKVADVVAALKDFSVNVDAVDPYASSEEVEQEYGFSLIAAPNKKYDAVIIAVAHEAYKTLDAAYFESISNGQPILVDLKNLYSKERMKDFIVWSL